MEKKTQFTKDDGHFPKWTGFFHAGTEWLEAFQLLDDERKKETGMFLFWVYPHVLYFALELFVKSLASYVNPVFDAKKDKLGHSITSIIELYRDRIPFF